MERENFSSGAKWEETVGYSRAVRIGPHVRVSGTVATNDDGDVVETDDPYEQTVRALEIVEEALARAGCTLADVIRTRLYVTDIGDWQAVGDAHGEFFGGFRPATSMVEVQALIEPGAVVEIEAEAIATGGDAAGSDE